MKLIWHIVKKDCVHLRWLLAAWLAIFSAQVALGIWAEGGSEALFKSASAVAGVNWILFDLQLFVAILLSVEIVHADLLVDPKAHWLTLPISGGELLVGKLVGVVLLIWLLPMAVLWPWWLIQHWGMTDLVLGTVSLALLHVLVTLPALLIATLTDSWTRFVTWAFVGAVAFCATGILLSVRYEASPLEIRTSPTVPWSQMLLGVGILVVVSAGVVVHQYLIRSRPRSVLAISLGSLIAALVASVWRMDFILPVMDGLGREPLPEAHLKLDRTPVSGGTDQGEYVGLDVEGTFNVARGDRVYGRLLDFGWKWSNGGSWSSRRADSFEARGRFFASRAPLNSKLNDGELFARQDTVYSLGLPSVPGFVSRKLLAEPAEFHAKVALAVIHPEVLAEVAPQPGNSFGHGAERFRIVSLERRKGFGGNVAVTGFEASTELGELVMIETIPLLRSYLQEIRRFPEVISDSFVFSNLVGKGDTQGRVKRSGNLSSERLGPFAGVLVFRYAGVVGPPRGYYPERPLAQRSVVLEPHWIDGLMLYWTRSRPVAREEMEIVEPHFVTQIERPSQLPGGRTIQPKL